MGMEFAWLPAGVEKNDGMEMKFKDQYRNELSLVFLEMISP